MATAHKKVVKIEPETDSSWSGHIMGLLSVFFIGALITYYVPRLPNSTYSLFKSIDGINSYEIIALILTTALTVIYLSYYRTKLFFSTKWLVAAGVYNFLILFVKFSFSSNEVSLHSSRSFGSLLTTALLVSLLYIFALLILYYLFDGRLLNKSLHKALIVTREGKTLLAMGLFVSVTLARLVLFKIPGLSGTTAANYLGDVFKANNALLSGLLFVMIVAGVEAFAQVRRREDLKPFVVSAIALVVSFHVWWALFMFRSYS